MDWELFLGKYCKVVVSDNGVVRVYSGKVVAVDEGKLQIVDKFNLPQVFAFSLIQKIEPINGGQQQ